MPAPQLAIVPDLDDYLDQWNASEGETFFIAIRHCLDTGFMTVADFRDELAVAPRTVEHWVQGTSLPRPRYQQWVMSRLREKHRRR